MGLLQRAQDLSAGVVQTAARWLNPQPYHEIVQMQAAFERRANEVIKSLATNKIRLLPYFQSIDGETPQMRRAYRAMMREPTVRAAIYQLVLPCCFANLEMKPASDNPVDKEAAEFIKDCILNSHGGIVQIVEATILGAMIEGYSVAEKVWDECQQGRWRGRSILKKVAARDTRHYQVEVDEYLNITAIIGTIDQKTWPTSKFITYRNMPVYDHPAGTSEMKAVYRPAWMLDTVWKLRQAGLQRWSMPFLQAKYPLNNKPVLHALETALANAKGDGFIIVPEGAAVEAMQIATGSQADFAAAVSDLRTEILIGITLAHLQSSEGNTTDGAGDTSIHKEVTELRVWRYLTDLATLILNDQVTPQLMQWNYPGRDYPKAMFSGVNDKDVLRELEIDERTQRMGFPVSIKGLVERIKRQPALTPEDTLKIPAAQPQPVQGATPNSQLFVAESSAFVQPAKPMPAAEANADAGVTAAGKV
jgi:hypothetical protein